MPTSTLSVALLSMRKGANGGKSPRNDTSGTRFPAEAKGNVCYILCFTFSMRPISAQLKGAAGRWCGPVALARAICCAVSLLSGVVTVQAQSNQTLRVVPLVREEHVLVSVELAGGMTDEVRDAIRSGLKTTFTYSVELRLDVPAWVDRTISTATVATSVEYDNLTRIHNMVRVLDGRIEESLSTPDEDVVRSWMTSLRRFPLFSTALLEPNREYYIRVSATARPSNGSIFWPFGTGPSAQSRFTFIR